MFGFTQPSPQGNYAPWGGLPTGQQPYTGSAQVWQPAQQAPWRLSPWQTQGMPTAAPPAPVAPQAAPAAPNPYLAQGTSGGIPGFDPMAPGGNMNVPAPPPAAPAPSAPMAYWDMGPKGSIGRITTDPYSIAPGNRVPVTPETLAQNPMLADIYNTSQIGMNEGPSDFWNLIHGQ